MTLARPIGLGARDSLRLEAGLPLYGHDLDRETTPVMAGLNFAINKRRRAEGGFAGAMRILAELENGPAQKRVGFDVEGRQPVREGALILDGEGNELGKITSGGFSPSLQRPIAMGYVATPFAEIGHSAQARAARQAVRRAGRRNAVRPPPLSPQGSRLMTLYFTKEHEWVRVEGDTATVGISNHAQEALGDIVFAEVPEAGRQLDKGQEAAVVESVKAASDVYAPVSGEVVEGNQAIADDPALINRDPEGEGWFFKLKLADPAELDGLMDEAAYREWVKTL